MDQSKIKTNLSRHFLRILAMEFKTIKFCQIMVLIGAKCLVRVL
jgi:hypothetical protein